MNTQKNTNFKRYDNLFEYDYILFFIVIVLRQFLMRTTIDTTLIRQPLIWLSFILGFIVLIKIAFEWKSVWDYKRILFGMIGAGMLVVCNLYLHHDLLGEYVLLILGIGKIDKNKILKVFLACVSILTIITILLCAFGKIENIITYRYGDSINGRMGLGFSYATCFSAQLLGIIAVWAYLRNEKASWLEVMAALLVDGICYYYTEARISCFCMLCIVLVIAFYKCLKTESNFITKLIEKKVIAYILCGMSILLSLMSIMLGYLYKFNDSIWEKLNSLSSQRLSMNALAFARYNNTLLGQSISCIGEIYSGQHSISDNYFVINTSYIDVLFRMGILGLISTLLIIFIISYKEYKSKRYINLLIMVIMCVFFFFEHRIYEINCNPFLILFMADGFDSTQLESSKIKQMECMNYLRKSKTVLSIFVLAFLIEFVVFNFTSVLAITNDEISYADCVQNTNNVYPTQFGTLKSDETSANLDAYRIPSYVGLDSAYLDLNWFDYNEYYHKENLVYEIDIYNLDYSQDEPMMNWKIDSKDPSSFFIPLGMGGLRQNLRFDIKVDEGHHFVINDFKFNSAKPFQMNYLRVIMLGTILSFLWLLLKKKDKNK